MWLILQLWMTKMMMIFTCNNTLRRPVRLLLVFWEGLPRLISLEFSENNDRVKMVYGAFTVMNGGVL